MASSDVKAADLKNLPAVPYKLTLKDGGIIEGNLPFRYFPGKKSSQIKAYWQGLHGIDWHLQENPIKNPETQLTDSSSALQILTTSYILTVPADLPQLKEIIPINKTSLGTPTITPEKFEAFLNIVRNTPQAKMIATPKLLTNNDKEGEIRTDNIEDAQIILKIKNTLIAIKRM